MVDKQMLMIPGPTPVPERVLLAMAQHPIGHRSPDFSTIIADINAKLKWLHQTENEIISLTASGTGAMEAGIINVLSAGDKVLVGSNGKFGDRWGKVARAFGIEVEEITSEWGVPLPVDQFEAKLSADTNKEIKAVIITHSETSSGVLNDLEGINQAVKAHGEALIIVDAVTSLGANNINIDELGLDVVGSGSQKGYMIPPGMAFVSMSDKAWAAYEKSTLPKFYFDFGAYRKSNAKDSSPFTPPVNLMFGLQESLTMMQEEGLDNIFARHARQKDATRAGIKALGLKLLAPDGNASHAVTAVQPEQVDAEQIRKLMKKKFGVALAGGQDHLKGKIFRIGHLGYFSDYDILSCLGGLEAVLMELGYQAPGSAVAAAAAVLNQG